MSIIDDILPGFEGSKTPYKIIENRRDAIAYAIENAGADDIILLAGKGHENYQIIGKEKIDFDEHAIAVSLMEEQEK